MKKLIALVLVPGIAVGVVVSAQGQKPAPGVAGDYVAPGQAVSLAQPLAVALAGLRAPALAAHIAFLASPALDGRGLGSRGLDAAAEYVAASLSLAGVPPARPAEDKKSVAAYFHAVPLREIAHASGQLTVETRSGGAVTSRTFLSGVDCLLPGLPPAVVTAPVVFAGYGIRETTPARDDYAGLDVKDKIVLLFGGLPAGAGWQKPDLAARYGSDSARQRYAAKVEIARSLGARVVVGIEGADFVPRLASGPGGPAPVFFVPADEEVVGAPPVVRVSSRAGDAILAAGGLTSATARAEGSRSLPGAEVTLRLAGDERLILSRNVIGIIPGADPTLEDQAVVIGTHMDHLGRSGETIYPGADDNASGVAALIEIARAFATSGSKPRRTLVFAFWTGEEEGKLGSGHYVRHPVWPLERTSVYLNLDMIGHPWTAEELRKLVADTHLATGEEFLARVKPADFIELGVAEWAPELAPVLMQAARGTGLALHLDRTDGKNGGSDYRDFARKGLPWVRFFGNYFDGYHEPSDTAEKVDAGQVLKMTRLALAAAWMLADR